MTESVYAMERLTPAFQAEATSLVNGYYATTAAKNGIPPYDFRWEMYQACEANGSLYTATARQAGTGELLGFAFYFFTEHPHHRGLWVAECDGIGVAPAARGRGVGRGIVGLAVPILQALGARKVLHKDRLIYGADSLFGKLGFAAEETLWVKELEPVQHRSDCAVHNGSFYPPGPCDCGEAAPPTPPVAPIEGALLRCPMCGGAAGIFVPFVPLGRAWPRGRCNVCETTGPGKPTEAEAIAAWNLRAETATVTAQLAAAQRGPTPALDAVVQRAREEVDAAATFLLERIEDWSEDNLTDDTTRDWFGHVEPAIGRLRAAIRSGGKDAAT